MKKEPETADFNRRRPSLVSGSLLVAGFIFTTLVLILTALPTRSDFALALFPPWWTRNAAFQAAARSGEVFSSKFAPTIFIVHGPATDLGRHLREEGALLVLNSAAFMACTGLAKPQ